MTNPDTQDTEGLALAGRTEPNPLRTVYVYNYHYSVRGSCRNRPLTYATFQTQGACVHKVSAGSRAEAFKAALAEHAGCDQSDRHCERCNPRVRRARNPDGPGWRTEDDDAAVR